MLLIRRLLCWLIILLTFYSAPAQLPATQQQAIILKRQIERLHYSPKPVDDSLSSTIFSSFIQSIDPRQIILLESDFQQLSQFKYKIDDELNGKSWQFLDLANKLYKQALNRVDSIIKSVFDKPFDLNFKEQISFGKKDEFTFARSAADLKTRYQKWYKYLLLDALDDISLADSARPSIKSLVAKYESKLREKLKKSELGKIRFVSNPAIFDAHLKEAFFNAVATSFDPHTMYFSPRGKENFQSELSGSDFSFGFDIDENSEGKVVVDELLPGGPAWKSGEVNKNDELLQVQWEGREPVDVSTLSPEEVEELFEQYNHGSITLKIRKSNGIVRSVVLNKEKVEMEEDIVKGYVLKGEKKIGYISLPDFYTSWEDENGSGCANDVAKEIVKLKKENIEGLVLDLRYNGGGSVGEALQMIGIFVDEGPLSGVKDKTGKTNFLKDPNRGTIYDGPLLLLINEESASASEMLAAALQDYNRAIVVGSNSYGKATMQKIFPVDTVYLKSTDCPNGYVKITTAKLYRVNGETIQRNGVLPDVVLPDVFDGLEFGEKFSATALPADTARKNPYYKPLPPLPTIELATASFNRIGKNEKFKAIRAAAASYKKYTNGFVVPLKIDDFENWVKGNESGEELSEEEIAEDSKIFTADNHAAEKQKIALNLASKEMNGYILKNIQQDIYIEEAFRILLDLVRIQKK